MDSRGAEGKDVDTKAVEGIIVPLFTPLDERERVIEGDLVTLVRFLLARGVAGFLAPSGTGEFFNLSFDERRRIVEIVAREARGQVPVIAIAGACSTQESLRLIEAARQAGADAVMATPPYYAPVDQHGLLAFFRTLAVEGRLPLWLYHQPGETKLTIEPETVAELAALPNVVGIKVSAGPDLLYFHRVVRIMRQRPAFRVLMGEDYNCLSAFVLGGHGAVATLANILPDEFVGLWRAVRTGDIATARALQDRIMDAQELLVFVRSGSMQSACKLVLQRRGIFSTILCTSPLQPLGATERATFESRAKQLGLF
jgi:4-hydroxy-tetrahydrodipicolinate synthase